MGTWTALVQWKGPPKKLRNDQTPDVILCLYAGENKCRIKGRAQKLLFEHFAGTKPCLRWHRVDRNGNTCNFLNWKLMKRFSCQFRVTSEMEKSWTLKVNFLSFRDFFVFFATFARISKQRHLEASNQIRFKLIQIMNRKSFHSPANWWIGSNKSFSIWELTSTTRSKRNWSSSRNENGSWHRNIC